MAKANAQQAIKHAQKLISMGQYRSASKVTEQLASAFPKNTQLQLLHATTLQRRGRYHQVIKVLDQVLQSIDPSSPPYALAITSIANAHTMLGDLPQAIATLQAGFAAVPESMNQGIAAALIDRHLDRDDQPAAETILAQLNITGQLPQETHPSLATAWARAKRKQLDPSDIIAALEPIADSAPRPYAISLTLGRLLEQANQPDRAFAHYEKANASNPPKHNRQHIEARRDQIINNFTAGALASLPRPPKSSTLPRPILILGMPRSGTSLVEQIISAHPSIAPAGESQALPELVAEMSQLGPQAANTQALTQLRDLYLDELVAAIATHTEPNEPPAFITDKNPMNLFLIAHALAFIPDAIIVRVLRDPRDICLSCYASPLADDHTFKFTLDDCAHFAAAAHQTLEHFRPIIQADPRATWIDVSYESLTQDPESEINTLFKMLNLEPHPDCFTFHQSTRAVQTISRDQVRQPMHTNSIARWQNFAHLPQVQAMCQTLEAVGVLTD